MPEKETKSKPDQHPLINNCWLRYATFCSALGHRPNGKGKGNMTYEMYSSLQDRGTTSSAV